MNVATTSNQSSSSSNGTGNSVQEFSIRVPKNQKKKFNIMRFNNNLNVDFSKWGQVRMERENNKMEKHATEEMPKFGAGSEFRREEKEEARKKRLGFLSRNYNPDDQPWILKSGGKNGKKFRGIREGGVGENAAYYVFTHGNDGSIEAYPVAEWYNFQPIQRFKALSAEEAEQEFGKRNRSLNYFSLMMRKKFRKDEDDEVEEEGASKKNKTKDFKISDIDDWIDSEEEDDEEDNDEASDEDKSKERKDSKKKKKKDSAAAKKTVAKKKKANSDESAFEESDDGDEEGRELDYITDSSESISDDEAKIDKEMKGVSDESALRKLLTSDEEEEEGAEGAAGEDKEKSAEDGNKSEQEDAATNEEHTQSATSSNALNKKNKKKKDSSLAGKSGSAGGSGGGGGGGGGGGSGDGLNKHDDTSSEFSADSSDSETEKLNKTESAIYDSQQNAAISDSLNSPEPVTKKPRLDSPGGESGISEEAVRRYLIRKPMTTTELLQKFKKPRTNLSSEHLVNVMTQILKKINPIKQTIKNKMYLSLKPENAAKSSSSSSSAAAAAAAAAAASSSASKF